MLLNYSRFIDIWGLIENVRKLNIVIQNKKYYENDVQYIFVSNPSLVVFHCTSNPNAFPFSLDMCVRTKSGSGPKRTHTFNIIWLNNDLLYDHVITIYIWLYMYTITHSYQNQLNLANSGSNEATVPLKWWQ